MAKFIEIKLTRSPIGQTKTMRTTVRTLGLRKMHSTVYQPNNEATKGQINKITHLVTCREVEERPNG